MTNNTNPRRPVTTANAARSTAFQGHRPAGLDEMPVLAPASQVRDQFSQTCCAGTKPYHTSRCRNAY